MRRNKAAVFLLNFSIGGDNMDLFKERIFSTIEGDWDLRTQFPIKPSSINNDGTVSGHFDTNKMSTVKKILAMTS